MWFELSLLGVRCGGGFTRNVETLDSRFRGNDRGLERVPFQMTLLPLVLRVVLRACKKRDELSTMKRGCKTPCFGITKNVKTARANVLKLVTR